MMKKMESEPMERILRLTLHKKWFDLVNEGKKKKEYRLATPYWRSRFYNKNGSVREYDYVIFKNGYKTDSPSVKVEWKGLLYEYSHVFEDMTYIILLGKVVE